jgi:antitoxin component of MazEF toxin-antitoxin module
MTVTLKLNARNDIHLPAEVLRYLNLGEDRILKAELKENRLVLVPVDLDPRYSQEELEGLDRLHEAEKKKGWIALRTDKDIENLKK